MDGNKCIHDACDGEREEIRALTVSEFLKDLRQRHIIVSLDGDRLRCSAPPRVLTANLREELQARKIDIICFLRMAQSLVVQHRALVPLQASGNHPPIFAVRGHAGDVFCYLALSQALGPEQPFYGLEPPGLDDATEPLDEIGDLTDYFSAAIREFDPAVRL